MISELSSAYGLMEKHEIQILVTSILERFWQFLKSSSAEFYKLVHLEIQAEMILLNYMKCFCGPEPATSTL